MPRRTRAVPLFVFALLSAGCFSAPSASVSGTVRAKGELLTTGEIHFVSANGASASAPITPDGAYQVINAPVGPVTVYFTGAVRLVSQEQAKQSSPDGGDTAPPAKFVEVALVPAKYTNLETSDLKPTLVNGAQEIPFDLGK